MNDSNQTRWRVDFERTPRPASQILQGFAYSGIAALAIASDSVMIAAGGFIGLAAVHVFAGVVRLEHRRLARLRTLRAHHSNTAEHNLDREVDERWTQHNAAKRAAGCPCGGPAEVRTIYPTAGAVSAEFWTCHKHQDADGWSRTGDEPAIPTYNTDTSCGQCINCVVLADDSRPNLQWQCYTHPRDRRPA